MSEQNEEAPKIQFKRKTRGNLRKRHIEDDDDDDEGEHSIREKVEEIKTIRKLRERPNGVNIVGLALGEKITPDVIHSSDPFNIKIGGMVDMAGLKKSNQKQDDTYEAGIGTQFNAETNKRDEDEEMVKYIEEELVKRTKKNNESCDSEQGDKSYYCSPEEAALQAVPEHLRQSSAHRSEEMLSNQMLSGIPEVDLGIEAKIRNIEATEEAKLKLIWDKHRKKEGPSPFVPTNMAVNFVQHNRFNIDDSSTSNKKIHARNKPVESGKCGKDKNSERDEKATDDYHYERFKKQFRRF